MDAAATGDSTFADVNPAAWYAEAAAWADETGIVTGTNNGFELNAPVTGAAAAAPPVFSLFITPLRTAGSG